MPIERETPQKTEKLLITADEEERKEGEVEFVPLEKTYYPSYKHLTPRQKHFYNYLKSELERGNPVDVGESISYIFIYLYEIMRMFARQKKYNEIIRNILWIKKHYGDYLTIKSYCDQWMIDCYILLGDYEKALETLSSTGDHIGTHNNNLLLNLKYLSGKPMTGKDFFELYKHACSENLTQWGLEHREDIEKYLDGALAKFEEESGQDFLTYLSEKYASERRYDYNVSIPSGRKLSEDEIKEVLRHSPVVRTWVDEKPELELKTYCYYGLGNYGMTIPFVRNTIESFREIENRAREQKGLPRVGEGWLSETELFYEIKKYFKNHRVVHHGRPEWLGKQHLDIFLPDIPLAIEYQGGQHFQPIEYFGGERAFQKLKELDERKKELCKSNGVTLLYVAPEQNFNEVIRLIKPYIKERGLNTNTKNSRFENDLGSRNISAEETEVISKFAKNQPDVIQKDINAKIEEIGKLSEELEKLIQLKFAQLKLAELPPKKAIAKVNEIIKLSSERCGSIFTYLPVKATKPLKMEDLIKVEQKMKALKAKIKKIS